MEQLITQQQQSQSTKDKKNDCRVCLTPKEATISLLILFHDLSLQLSSKEIKTTNSLGSNTHSDTLSQKQNNLYTSLNHLPQTVSSLSNITDSFCLSYCPRTPPSRSNSITLSSSQIQSIAIPSPSLQGTEFRQTLLTPFTQMYSFPTLPRSRSISTTTESQCKHQQQHFRRLSTPYLS